MNKRRTILIFVLLSVLFLALVIYIYLGMTGYILLEDQSNKEFEKVKQEINAKKHINFNSIVGEKWDIAICVTNQNELNIIEKCSQKGLIDEECYMQLDPSMHQLSQIIFVNQRKVVETLIYDNRYYKLIPKENEIFYPDDCTFEVKKRIFKTTLEQK